MQLTQLFFLKNISIDKKFLIVSAAFITPIAFYFTRIYQIRIKKYLMLKKNFKD